jgi:NAD(P)H-flavin reductase
MSCCGASGRDIYLPEQATIVRNRPVTALENFIEVRFDSGRDLGHMPGQFVMLSIPGIGEAPISVSSSPDRKGSFEMVVRRVGRLTSALHRLPEGSRIGVRGPYGTHFPVEDGMKGRDVLFITGGIGLVPVRSAIHYVLNRRREYGQVTILYGTKSPAERLFLDELREWSQRKDITYMETVDRGDESWKGNVGVITTLMPKVSIRPDRTTVIVCGPPVMYKFVIVKLYEMNVPQENIYVSLERRMKCGVGKCGHCQINGLYTCLDGPVFRFADVAEVQEAI